MEKVSQALYLEAKKKHLKILLTLQWENEAYRMFLTRYLPFLKPRIIKMVIISSLHNSRGDTNNLRYPPIIFKSLK